MNEAGPKGRQQLQLLLVAARHHLSGNDLRSLVHYLEREDVGFEVTLQLADPTQQPELLELHRLVVTPALIKLAPSPKQVFAGSNILQQLRVGSCWQQDGVVSGLGLSLRPTELDGAGPKRTAARGSAAGAASGKRDADRPDSRPRTLVAHGGARAAHASHRRRPRTAKSTPGIDMDRFQDVITRRLQEMEALSKDLLEVGTTRWETLFNPQRLDLASVPLR